jgi:hypothetical protein
LSSYIIDFVRASDIFAISSKDERFLVSQISVGKRHLAVNFHIDFGNDVDASLLHRLAYQFAELRLNVLYQVLAVDVLKVKDQREKIQSLYDAGCGPEEARQSLEGDATTLVLRYGHNHWEGALLRALADHYGYYTLGYLLG